MAEQEERRDRSQPETLRLNEITPAITVDDLSASLAFYRDVLGFTVKEKWEHEGVLGGVALIAGTAHLMLQQDDFAKGRDRPKGVALRFWFSTSRPVDELAADVRARGGTLESGPEDLPWGGRAISVVDPDGFRITITSES
jgi:catechol 2,3-dioxygenase-like lactoylglutathione lyase family enzyme